VAVIAIKGCKGKKDQVAILSKSIETPMSCDEVEFPTWKLNVELSFPSPRQWAA